MSKLRIQKYLSQSGVCSRRKAEEYIERGLVSVNGTTANIGESIDPELDKIELNGEAIQEQKELVYYKINKPRGIETTCAQNGQAIVDIVNIKKRVFPIGRLDMDSTGLLILTNDGRLANFLMHPRYEHEKEYIVETFGPIDDISLEKMKEGVFILGSYTKKSEIKRISSGKFSIVLTEGRNRQIRRMVEKIGGGVKKLKRVRIENIKIGDLKEGDYQELTHSEKKELFKKLKITQY